MSFARKIILEDIPDGRQRLIIDLDNGFRHTYLGKAKIQVETMHFERASDDMTIALGQPLAALNLDVQFTIKTADSLGE